MLSIGVHLDKELTLDVVVVVMYARVISRELGLVKDNSFVVNLLSVAKTSASVVKCTRALRT